MESVHTKSTAFGLKTVHSKEVMRNEQYTIDVSRRLKFVISITNRYAVDRFVSNADTTTLNNKNFGWDASVSHFFIPNSDTSKFPT